MALAPTVTLNNGIEMPIIGLGTYLVSLKLFMVIGGKVGSPKLPISHDTSVSRRPRTKRNDYKNFHYLKELPTQPHAAYWRFIRNLPLQNILDLSNTLDL